MEEMHKMYEALFAMEDEDYEALVLSLGVGKVEEIEGNMETVVCHPYTLSSLATLLVERGNNPESVAVGVWK